MSEYGGLIGADAVRFKRLLPGPIERVWSYLTETEKRASWRIGGHVDLHFHNASLSGLPDTPHLKNTGTCPRRCRSAARSRAAIRQGC